MICMGIIIDLCTLIIAPIIFIFSIVAKIFYCICLIVFYTFVAILNLIIGDKRKHNVQYDTRSFGRKNNTKKDMHWTKEQFERDADLWGLSQEDRRIAKEENMTPAEYIEAEERDDDELFTDEWEH